MANIDKRKDEFLSTFESLRPDLFYPEAWTETDRSKANEAVRASRTKTNMYSSIPMKCMGSKCYMADTCPLIKINKAPVGMPCPIEMKMVIEIGQAYSREMNVDEESMVETSIVRDLVDQEIQQIRKSKVLAKEDFIIENPVGIDSNGDVILKKELHQAVEYEDRLHKRKRELLKQMAATRAEKAKIGQGNLDTAQTIATAFSKLAELETAQNKLLRAKLGVADRDEYIDAVEAEIIEPEE